MRRRPASTFRHSFFFSLPSSACRDNNLKVEHLFVPLYIGFVREPRAATPVASHARESSTRSDSSEICGRYGGAMGEYMNKLFAAYACWAWACWDPWPSCRALQMPRRRLTITSNYGIGLSSVAVKDITSGKFLQSCNFLLAARRTLRRFERNDGRYDLHYASAKVGRRGDRRHGALRCITQPPPFNSRRTAAAATCGIFAGSP